MVLHYRLHFQINMSMYNLCIRIIAGIGLSNSVIDTKSQTSILKIKKKTRTYCLLYKCCGSQIQSFVRWEYNEHSQMHHILNGSKAINIYYINKHISKVNHT